MNSAIPLCLDFSWPWSSSGTCGCEEWQGKSWPMHSPAISRNKYHYLAGYLWVIQSVTGSSNYNFLGKWSVGRHSWALSISQAKSRELLRASLRALTEHSQGISLRGWQERILWISCARLPKAGPYSSQASCHTVCLPQLFFPEWQRFAVVEVVPHPCTHFFTWSNPTLLGEYSSLSCDCWRAGKTSSVGSLVFKAVSHKICYPPSLSAEWKNWTVIHAVVPFLCVLKVLNQK